jgi:hypothetical protein
LERQAEKGVTHHQKIQSIVIFIFAVIKFGMFGQSQKGLWLSRGPLG